MSRRLAKLRSGHTRKRPRRHSSARVRTRSEYIGPVGNEGPTPSNNASACPMGYLDHGGTPSAPSGKKSHHKYNAKDDCWEQNCYQDGWASCARRKDQRGESKKQCCEAGGQRPLGQQPAESIAALFFRERPRLRPALRGGASQLVRKVGRDAERSNHRVTKLKFGDRPKQDGLSYDCDALPGHKEVPAKWSENPHHSNPESGRADTQSQNTPHVNAQPHRT